MTVHYAFTVFQFHHEYALVIKICADALKCLTEMTNVLWKLNLKINETFSCGIIFRVDELFFRICVFIALVEWKPMSCGWLWNRAFLFTKENTICLRALFIRSNFHCKFSFFLSHQILCLHKTPFGECRWLCNFPINFINLPS